MARQALCWLGGGAVPRKSSVFFFVKKSAKTPEKGPFCVFFSLFACVTKTLPSKDSAWQCRRSVDCARCLCSLLMGSCGDEHFFVFWKKKLQIGSGSALREAFFMQVA